MNLISYIEQQIEQEILDDMDLYSLDSMLPYQVRLHKEKYYRRLWDLISNERQGE
jgi:hypothetical protein